MYEFINLFLASGCLFESDQVLQRDSQEPVSISSSGACNIRRYAEFFTDFSIQESQLVKVDPLSLSCAILAATRKHMNLEVVWNQEISQLTTLKLSDFREVFEFLDRRYSKSFPESVQNQERQVNGRQRLEPMRHMPVPEQHL